MCSPISAALLKLLCYLDIKRFAGKLGTLPTSPETFEIEAKGPPVLKAQMRRHLSRGLCACPLGFLSTYQLKMLRLQYAAQESFGTTSAYM